MTQEAAFELADTYNIRMEGLGGTNDGVVGALAETGCSNNAEQRFQFSSPHVGGCQFSLSDGSARFISENIDRDLFRSLVTRSGGEVVGEL